MENILENYSNFQIRAEKKYLSSWTVEQFKLMHICEMNVLKFSPGFCKNCHFKQSSITLPKVDLTVNHFDLLANLIVQIFLTMSIKICSAMESPIEIQRMDFTVEIHLGAKTSAATTLFKTLNSNL